MKRHRTKARATYTSGATPWEKHLHSPLAGGGIFDQSAPPLPSEQLMIDSETTVCVSDELIRAGESGNGGWSKKQLALLGIAWPPQKGWRRAVNGLKLTKSDADLFVALKGAHLGKGRR